MQICEKLRSVTHTIHMQLHKHPLLSVLTSPLITIDEIRIIQQALYGFWQPLQINSAAMELTSPIAQWLKNDLTTAGIKPDKLDICKKLPQLCTEEDLLGVCYVREGSLLGGQVIFKNIAKVLPHHTDSISFFLGRGKDTPRHWGELIAYIEMHSQGMDQDAICDAAVNTFDCFKQWMDHCYQIRTNAQNSAALIFQR